MLYAKNQLTCIAPSKINLVGGGRFPRSASLVQHTSNHLTGRGSNLSWNSSEVSSISNNLGCIIFLKFKFLACFSVMFYNKSHRKTNNSKN